MDKDMRNIFPDDTNQIPLQPDQHQHWPSSSSSSFRSLLSTGGSPPEYSSLLMSNMMASTSTPGIEHAIRPTSTTISQDPHTIQNYIGFLNQESDDAVMARAMLAVISSPPSWPSSSFYQPQPTPTGATGRRGSAFKKYICAPLGPRNVQINVNRPRQNMLKRAVTILRNVYLSRIEEQTQASRPTTTSQLLHMRSERKRRERLNQTFQELRSLLPPGTKKDKASVLLKTRDYLSSLKAEVSELKEKNLLLEARISNRREAAGEEAASTSNERIQIMITRSSESTSEECNINLQVTVRGACLVTDLVIRTLQILKQTRNATLEFIEADSESQQASQLHRMNLQFKIKSDGWDESAFRETMKRVVEDVAPRQMGAS